MKTLYDILVADYDSKLTHPELELMIQERQQQRPEFALITNRKSTLKNEYAFD